MNLLRVSNLNTGYGKKQVLFDFSLDVRIGECLLLVGSNGSGKSTLFKAIYRVLPLWNGANEKVGKILYNEEDITDIHPHLLIDKGLMYIPQKKYLFEDLTVKENLECSILHRSNKKSFQSIDNIFEKLSDLKNIRTRRVVDLSGGERKLLTLGMVLLNNPNLLLYDEPFAGLSEQNFKIVLKWLKFVKEEGTTLVIIEHRMKQLESLVDRILDFDKAQATKLNQN